MIGDGDYHFDARPVDEADDEVEQRMMLHVVDDVDIVKCKELIPSLPAGVPTYDKLSNEERKRIENEIIASFGDLEESHWDDKQFFDNLLRPGFEGVGIPKGFRLQEGRSHGPGGDIHNVPDSWLEFIQEVSNASWSYVRFLIEVSNVGTDDGETKSVQLFRHMQETFRYAPFMPCIYGLVLCNQTVRVAYTDQETGWISEPIDLKLSTENGSERILDKAEFLAKFLYHVMNSMQGFVSYEGEQDGTKFILRQLPDPGTFYELEVGGKLYFTPDVASSEISLYGKNTTTCLLRDEENSVAAHLRFSWGSQIQLTLNSRLGSTVLDCQGAFFQLQDDLGHYGERFVKFFTKSLSSTLPKRPAGLKFVGERKSKLGRQAGKSWNDDNFGEFGFSQSGLTARAQQGRYYRAATFEAADIPFRVRHCELILTTPCQTYDEAYRASVKPEVDVVSWVRSATCYMVYEYATMNAVHGDFSLNNIVLTGKSGALCARLIDPEFVSTPNDTLNHEKGRCGTLPFISLAVCGINDKFLTRDLCHDMESVLWACFLQPSKFIGFRLNSNPGRQFDNQKNWDTLSRNVDEESMTHAKFYLAWVESLEIPEGLPARYEAFTKLLSAMHKIFFTDIVTHYMDMGKQPDWRAVSEMMQKSQLANAVKLLKCMDDYLADYGYVVYKKPVHALVKSTNQRTMPARYEPNASIKALLDLLSSEAKAREDKDVKRSEASKKLIEEIEGILKSKYVSNKSAASQGDAVQGATKGMAETNLKPEPE